jgi:hypothetical protein
MDGFDQHEKEGLGGGVHLADDSQLHNAGA